MMALHHERIVSSEWSRESIHDFRLQALVVLTSFVARLGTSTLEKGSHELPKRMKWGRQAGKWIKRSVADFRANIRNTRSAW
jgi:hypothetical protein